jgi:hypothetical protein
VNNCDNCSTILWLTLGGGTKACACCAGYWLCSRQPMPDVLVASGGGPYADQWHRFPATCARIARIIEDLGLSVDITEEVERGLAEPGGCRLLIVTIGKPADPRPSELIEAGRTGIEDHLASGGALLGVYSSATPMTTMSPTNPAWSTTVLATTAPRTTAQDTSNSCAGRSCGF